MKRPLLLLVLFMFFVGACKKRDLAKVEYVNPLRSVGDDALFVVFSSSVEGYVQSCGCTSAPLGDIARYAQVFGDIKALNQKSPLFIDAGNLLFDTLSRNAGDRCQDDARINVLLGTFKDLGLKQTIAGPFDDARGTLYRDEWYKSLTLHAFLQDLEYRIIEHQGQRIGLIGLRAPSGKEALQAAILALKEQKASLIIALSQRPKQETMQIFANAHGIDVVIQGQVEAFASARPLRLSEKGPIFIEGGRQQHYFSFLIAQKLEERGEGPLKLDDRAYLLSAEIDLVRSRLRSLQAQITNALEEKRQFLSQRIAIAQKELKALEAKNQSLKPLVEPSITFQAIPLSKNVDALLAVSNKLEAYEKSIPALVSECEKHIECPEAALGKAYFVGAKTCKACHAQAYEVWKKAVFWSEGQNDKGEPIKRHMGHSKAWETLVQAKKDKDRSCIGCHSIGFMQPGGYCKTSDVGNRVDVQCESCHGPGSLHAQSGDKKLMQKATEQSCRECHHVPHIESYDSFKYDEKVQLILGPGHGERLLKQLQHKAKAGES